MRREQEGRQVNTAGRQRELGANRPPVCEIGRGLRVLDPPERDGRACDEPRPRE
jgi:hypothetical protein